MDHIFHFFEELTMLGPGDNQITEDLLRFITQRKTPLILDIGSGTGRQTRVLAASVPEGRIIPVDLYIPFLQKMQDIRQVSPVCGTMDQLPFKEKRADLIWSEGAISIIGFSAGLTRWRPLLKEGGYLIVSEICWFDSPPPDELRTYWESNYPAISTEEERIRDAREAGFEIIRTQRLPSEAWEKYYREMNPVIDQWKEKSDPEVAAFLSEMEEEIRIFREYGSYYGYTFFILKKK